MQSSVLGPALKPSAIPWSAALICPPPDYTAPTGRTQPSSKTQHNYKDNGDYKNNYNGDDRIIIICFHKHKVFMAIFFIHCSNYFPFIRCKINKYISWIINIQSSTFVQTRRLDIMWKSVNYVTRRIMRWFVPACNLVSSKCKHLWSNVKYCELHSHCCCA